MKQLSILGLLFCILSFSNAQVVTTWQGPSNGGSWTDAANWDNGVPTSPTTEIVFDGAAVSLTGGVINIPDVSAQTNPNFSFDKLTVINNAAVNVSGGGQIYWYFNVSINIEAGSRLNAGGTTATLFVVGGTLSTIININGTLDLQGQGTGNSTRTAFEPLTSFFGTGGTTVRGNLILSGKVAVVNMSTPGNFIVESGGAFLVTRDGGTVPNGNYKNGSLIKVEGVVNTATNFVSATYNGVIEWNCPGQMVRGSSALLLPSSSFNSFDSLVISNTNTGTVRLATNPAGYLVKNIILNSGTLEFGSPTGSGNYICNIDTIIQNGGLLVGNAAGVAGFDNAFVPDTINVRGKFLQNGGVFDLSNRTPNNAGPDASCIVKIAGDMIIGGEIKLSQPANAPNCAVEFNGSGTQIFSVAVSGMFLNKIKTVINNSSPVAGVSAAGNITLPDSLVFKKGYFFLNDFDLTNPLPVQPVLNPFQTHVVTNGTGLFIQKNVTISPVGIPIGATTTSVNPLIIGLTAAGVADIGAKVNIGFNPAIVSPNTAVNRTWSIKPVGLLPANLAVSFGYSDLGAGLGDGNPGFSYTANNEVGLYDGSNWQIISLPGGIVPAGTNPYAISQVILSSLLVPNIITPLVVGNLTSVLSVSNIINLSAVKAGSTAVLKWDVTELTAAVSRFEILRSADSRNFTSIGTALVQGNQAYYSFADNSLLPGINYYRVKIIDHDGGYKYSVIAAIINKEAGILLTSLLPSIVNSGVMLAISSAAKGPLQLTVTDMQGRIVKKISTTLYAGSNQLSIDCAGLAAGTYQIAGYSQDQQTNVLRFVKK